MSLTLGALALRTRPRSKKLVDEIVPFNIKHHAESDACDLLIEVDRLADIRAHVTPDNHARVCAYLAACADYATDAEDKDKQLRIVQGVRSGRAVWWAAWPHRRVPEANGSVRRVLLRLPRRVKRAPHGHQAQRQRGHQGLSGRSAEGQVRGWPFGGAAALAVGVHLPDPERACRTLLKQMAFMMGQARVAVAEYETELLGDSELMELAGNQKARYRCCCRLHAGDDDGSHATAHAQLSRFFRDLARDLDVQDAKSPDDIYKTHLVEGGALPARLPLLVGQR